MAGNDEATLAAAAGSRIGVGSRPPAGFADFISLEAFNEFKTTKPQGPGTQKDIFTEEFPET